jgi:hypothetical protein
VPYLLPDAREADLSEYIRYRIETEPAPHLADHPSRFKVRMNRLRLAQFLLKELVHFGGDLEVMLSRPCVYGVYSGPVGGFLPRDELCVGCLRCTVQYPDMVEILPNPARQALGDSFVTPDQVDTILYEASTGRVPVRGAGYRGAYGGDGWDGIWTDMSEIVRPTRDGIHGREFISTSVDLGRRPMLLELDAAGWPVGELPRAVSLPLPFLFDTPPRSAFDPTYLRSLAQAAAAVGSLVILPLPQILDLRLSGSHIVPLVTTSDIGLLSEMDWQPALVELEDEAAKDQVRQMTPEAQIILRTGDLERAIEAASEFDVIHLVADYHGHLDGLFGFEAIHQVHQRLVELGVREKVSLLGSGGIAAAEHVPKAIIAGLDAVALDTAPLLAVQAQFNGEVVNPMTANIDLPRLEQTWATQRLVNLCASWRDQLLEIMGAMGLREVRRLRGETGRAMFQNELEREAFAGIEGYPHG